MQIKMKDFRGSFTVMITPMTKEQEIDENGIRENIDWQISEGIAGLCPLGSTGEFVSLSREERFRVAKIAVEHVKGRVPVLLGTAAETTKEVIEYTQNAKELGADGALIINPYYCKPAENEIYEFFKMISEAVDIPVMVYNNPFTSGIDMKAELLAKIAQLKNMAYIKDASMEIRRVKEIINLTDGRMKVFNGTDDIAFEAFLAGAVGWIAVCGNIIPGLSQQLFDLVEAGEIQKAKELNQKILPLLSFIENSGKLVQVVKAAVNKIGHAAGPSRLPRLPLTPEEDEKLVQILKNLGVL
ncbi:4-hydroxy-tetrahydrodipicolinate synthase [Desulfosporosinus sp. PR]|uniref:4-hydroxy-tetrahydrodipicolinate synthase n=1 Tax=Candidatus Desulfosporosinus nitrosoreducens TaxID=3401928 RepID=UPI0027F36E64|nr:4-hydroxy-tetrahydrodipicolinate synthase [Desulfosporosinus sp. PR]MDQ7095122.1 4-hydroxy-tetrahydrodipicolinate synthase [Desulfosporosinus sp. PR]